MDKKTKKKVNFESSEEIWYERVLESESSLLKGKVIGYHRTLKVEPKVSGRKFLHMEVTYVTGDEDRDKARLVFNTDSFPSTSFEEVTIEDLKLLKGAIERALKWYEEVKQEESKKRPDDEQRLI